MLTCFINDYLFHDVSGVNSVVNNDNVKCLSGKLGRRSLAFKVIADGKVKGCIKIDCLRSNKHFAYT